MKTASAPALKISQITRTKQPRSKVPFALSAAALVAVLGVPAHSAVLYWDVNGTASGFSTVVGGWNGTNIFWNTDATGGNSGTTTATTTSADDLIIAQATTNTGSITVTGTQNASSITFAANVGPTTTITGGTIVIGGTGASSGIFQQSSGANTISSALTLNSTVSAFNFSNSSSGLLTIGAVTGAASSGTQTITVGASSTGGITLGGIIGNGANGGNVALNINSSGAGITTLSGASTFTGGVTMTAGTASFTSTGLGSGKITFAGNSTLQWGASTTTDLSARLIINTGVTATLDTGANNVAFASVFGLENNSKGTLKKTGSGTLTLSNAANQFAGNIVISNGKVALGNQYGMWQSAYDTTGSTGAIGLNVTGQVTPWLGGLAGSVDLATAITGYSAITTLTLNPQSGSSVSYSGVIANTATNLILSKSGLGTQTLTNTNTYSGATTVWAGTLALSGASGSALSSAFTVRGGTLLLDNSGGTFISRLNTGTALSLGSLTLNSYNGAGSQTQTVGATTFAVGGKVTINNGTGGSDRTDFAMGAVTRSAGAAIDFVGTNGTLGSGANSPNATSTGAWGSAQNGILPWATVGGTAWGQDNANSIRAYAGAFTAFTGAGATSTTQAQQTGAASPTGAAIATNSLNVISDGSTNILNLGNNVVSFGNAAGSIAAILKSGTNPYTISASGTGSIRAGSAGAGTELIAHVDGGALTISAPLNTAIVNIAKGGTGDLILSGTRAADFTGAISIAGGQLEFQGASTTISGVITGLGGLTSNLSAGQTLTINNNSNSYAGPTIVKGGYFSGGGYPSQGLPGGIGSGGPIPGTNTSQIMSNLILNGGVIYNTYTFNKDLGAGPGQVQILAGTSGFVNTANSGGAAGFVLDGGRELVWGSTYFNPTVFVHSLNNGANLTLNLANGFDLAGSTRTILVGDSTYNGSATGISQLGGVIRTSSGTAGLTKTGIGNLLLTGASTYNGATTVSAGILSFQGNANVASANPLGQSSAAAANLLLANGATLQYSGAAASTDRGFTINGTTAGDGASLDASGSAAINFTNTASPAYGTAGQTRTLTLTGTNVNNNTLAANIADNGAGAVSVTKTGAGLWVLTGTSAYTGPTTITAGTLSASATANLGGATSNLVFNGGTLQVTNTSNLPNFSTIGHTVVFNSGKTVGLDISSGTFTVDQVLNQGTGGLTKAGAGTLVINSAHTYTGGTTISAGTLRIDSGGSLAGGTTNNSIYLINQNATTGTAPLTNIFGSGSIAVGAGFTITINSGTGLAFNALNTTGGGSFALSGVGVTTPTLGGLVGTTGNLSSAFSSGYSGVTNLTLNTVSGSSFTYGGVIDNGATPMSLTKTGAGTQTLTGTNTYTGTTFLNGGVLSVGDGTTTGKITGTTALQFNGGTLTYKTLGANSNVDAIPDGAGITVNTSSTFNATSANAGGGSNNETVGAVTLNAGQMNFNWTNGGSSGTLMTLTSLSRSGTASAVFNSGFASNNSRWAVTGSGSTTAGQIIGPWYTTGGNGAGFASTDYAVFSSGFVAQAAIAGSAETTWTTAANAYTTSAGATVTLTGTRTITALRNTGATTVLTLASGADLQTYGLLNGVSTLLTVAPGTGGVLTTPANGGNLYVNAGAGAITVSAPIKDSGGSPTAVTLVKNGSNTLTLSSTTSNYSGGTVINGGTLAATADTNLGASVASANLITSAQAITVNGDATLALGNGGVTYYRSILLNGANLAFPGSGNNPTIAGAVTGTGGVSIQGGTAVSSVTLSSLNNTFTGAVGVGTGTGSSTGPTISVASLVDSVGAGNIIFNYGYAATSATFSYMATAVVPLTLNNRQIVVANNSAGNIGIATIQNLNTTNAITINTPLSVTTSLAGTHTLALDAVAGPVNAFNGTISDGGAGVFISLSKTGAGTWAVTGNNTFTGGVTVSTGTLVLSGTNQYTGATNITNGTLSVNSVSDYNVASAIGAASSGAIALANTGSGNTGTLQYTGSGNSTNRQVQVGPISQNNGGGQILNNGTGALIFSATTFNGDDSTTGGSAGPRTLTLGGTYTGVSEIQGAILANTGAPTSRDINIVKNGIGTWSFAGANTYTGGNQTGNTINLGTLRGTQNSGTPFGTAAVTINAGTLSLAPTGSGSAVSLTGGTKAAGTLFTYNADAILSLNKGTQTSLTYTFGGTGTTTARGTNGTLILSASDITNFGAAGGNAERFIMNGTAPTQVNTIVSGVVIQDRNNSNAGDFAAYDATNGFTKATYTLSNTFSGSTNASLVNIASPTSTGTIAAYAVKVSGTTLTNTGTLTLGGSATGVAGLILNNGTISGGTSLTTPTSVAVELTVYTSGTSVISTPILTATSQAGMSVFGPGTLDLSGATAANTFTGGLRINNSTVIATNDNQLGGTTSQITLTGGTLQTSGTFGLGGAGSRAITLAAGQNQTGGTFSVTGGTTTYTNSSSSSKFMSGTGSLTKTGGGNMVLSGNTANTYTGATIVSGGTLDVRVGLTGTTGVTVNTGGTLLLNSTLTPNNTVGNGTVSPVGSTQTFTGAVGSTAVTGGGGTLTVGQSGSTQSYASLALNANTILDFGSGNTGVNMVFGGTPTLNGNTLTINNWSGPAYNGLTTDSTNFGTSTDRLIFTSDPSGGNLGMALTGISFNGTVPGMAVSFGSYYEIVPVPEPATTALIGSLALCALIGYRERGRFVRVVRRTGKA